MNEEKKAVVVLADGCEDVEALTPIDMLRRAGVRVTVAGLGKKIILTSHRVTIVADAEFAKVKDEDWDAIILPGGGKGAENLAADYDVVSTAIRLFNEGKIVAAICASPAVVLGSSGILEGRHVTCYPGAAGKAPHISFDLGSRVCKDGNLITSQGAGTALEWALDIVGSMMGAEAEENLKKRVIF